VVSLLFGSFWVVSLIFSSFWVVSLLFSSFWVVLARFGWFWVVLGGFGSFRILVIPFIFVSLRDKYTRSIKIHLYTQGAIAQWYYYLRDC